MADTGILYAQLSSFTCGKSGQVLITYSLGVACDMPDLHYNTHTHTHTGTLSSYMYEYIV